MKLAAAVSFLLLLVSCGPSAEAPSEGATAAPEFEVKRQFLYPPEFAPGKAYSPGVLAGDTLYIAGQVSLDPKTGQQPEGIEAQTRQAMDNVGHVLRAAGLGYQHLVSCHVQLDDMQNYAAMNKVYGGYYEPGRYPARTTLEMPGLAGGAHLEITCTAYAGDQPIETITPPEGAIPAAMGPYSPAVRAGDTVYLSGQGGVRPQDGQVAEGIAAQTQQTLENISQILKAAGLGLENVVSANSYYLGPENHDEIVAAFPPLVRSAAVPVLSSFCLSRLPGTIAVEITFVAHRNPDPWGLVLDRSNPQAVPPPVPLAGDTFYLSAVSSPQSGPEFEAQFRGVIELLRTRLELAGMDLAHVVNAQVYLKNVGDFDTMNKLFDETFGAPPPARTTVQIREEGARAPILLEVALVAVR